jgi:hypothetical protein
MRSRTIAAILATYVLALPALAAEIIPATPYTGQQDRQIKALSVDDIAALRKGEGMGMAKAAELNGYPGPAHVLTLAKQLALTKDQLERVTAICDLMSAAAKPLGDELIEHEQRLDQFFASREITPANLATEIAAIGGLNGRLRSVHLTAHLETRALLRPEQIALYRQLRRYDGPAAVPHQQFLQSRGFQIQRSTIGMLAPPPDHPISIQDGDKVVTVMIAPSAR